MNAERTLATRSGGARFCTFVVDSQVFGLPVEDVQEVLRSHVSSRVPLSPPTVHGLINLRGDIVMTVDLRRRLAMPAPTSADVPPMHVIVRADDGVTSLLVDQVRDVVTIDDSQIEPVPPNAPSIIATVANGVAQLDAELLVLLDAGRLLDLSAGSSSNDNNPGGPS